MSISFSNKKELLQKGHPERGVPFIERRILNLQKLRKMDFFLMGRDNTYYYKNFTILLQNTLTTSTRP